MPPADFLYVKWRDKTTDQVYEDRVDLRKRLPPFDEMYGQKVYFLVEDNQLYVYLIPRTEWGEQTQPQTAQPTAQWSVWIPLSGCQDAVPGQRSASGTRSV